MERLNQKILRQKNINCKNQSSLTKFTLISILYPLITAWLLINSTGSQIISLPNINFTFIFSAENKLIGLALLIVTLITNLYAISKNQKHELIIGNIYSAASLTCLLAGDLISMFIALEFMMIGAAILIFYGGHQDSTRAARQYFLTHLFSGSLILIGIIYIITATGNTQIISLTPQFFDNNFYIIFILIGCLINVAVVPFSGWMVNCYPASSNSSFIYLISFSSKVSLMILLKLFSGLEMLKFAGILMILYGGIFAVIENNLKKLLCYLAISQAGFMLIAIGENSHQTTLGIIAFLFIHIIYKALFALYIAILNDQRAIENFSKITSPPLLKNPLLFSSLIIIVLTMIGMPWLASFSTKIAVTSVLDKDINYYMIILLKYLTCLVMFSFLQRHLKKHSITTKKQQPSAKASILPNNASNLSLTLILASTFITSIFLPKILAAIWPAYPLEILKIEANDLAQQLLILLLGLISATAIRKLPRYSTTNINLDLPQLLERGCHRLKSKYQQEYLAEDITLENSTNDILQETTLHRLKSLHNQGTSLFIVLILLVSLIIILNS